jgi:hypothetical protein
MARLPRIGPLLQRMGLRHDTVRAGEPVEAKEAGGQLKRTDEDHQERERRGSLVSLEAGEGLATRQRGRARRRRSRVNERRPAPSTCSRIQERSTSLRIAAGVLALGLVLAMARTRPRAMGALVPSPCRP